MVLAGFKSFLISAFLFQMAACSSMPPEGEEYDNFAEYAESVFRHQNILISRIMMSDNEAIQNNAALEDAEQSMNDACHLLNEYAERENAGESMSLFFKREVKASIENCDHKVHKLDALLADLNK